MQVWITRPPNHADSPLNARLEKRWRNLIPDVQIVTAEPYEIHGDLLGRVWQAVLDSDEPMNVISELDFIPYDTFQMTMLELLSQSPAYFCEFVTRNQDLTLNRWGPASGAWLIGLNRDLKNPDLPLDWLGPKGQHNDAANGAYGLYPEDPDVVFDEGTDEAPTSLGIEYESLGYHCFFNRHFVDPPSTELFKGYTLARHLADINARLDALEAK